MSDLERKPSETRVVGDQLLEALENLMGLVNTPIGRRKLGIDPDHPVLVEAEKARWEYQQHRYRG